MISTILGLLLATGGTHTQSSMVCGHSFDVYWLNDPSGRPKGKCFDTPLGAKTFPLAVNDIIEIKGHFTNRISRCQSPPAPNGERWLYQVCDVTPANYCTPTGQVYLLPMWHDWNGEFKLDNKKRVMAACVPPIPPIWPPPPLPNSPLPPANPGSPYEQAGGVGKCIHDSWFGFAPDENDSNSMKLFSACVRMARADYSGSGESETHQGIWVETGTRDQEVSGKALCTLNGGCFESIWSDKEAVCFARPRWAPAIAAMDQVTEELLKIQDKLTDKEDKTLMKKKLKTRAQWIGPFLEYGTSLYKSYADDKAAVRPPAPCKWKGNDPGLIYNRSRRYLDLQECSSSDYDIPTCKQGAACLPWEPNGKPCPP